MAMTHGERQKRYQDSHKEILRIRRKERYLKHRDELLAKRRAHHASHRKESIESHHKYYQENHEQCLQRRRDWGYALKLEVLSHYSHGAVVCARCGYSDARALTIDHLNGDGANHRRSIGQIMLYSWLKHNNWPSGFQVLCYNCNIIKARENKEFGCHGTGAS